jgi:hypothetical protein
MPLSAPFDSPMVTSGGEGSELTKKSLQPIQNISLRPPSMMSRMSGYEHVTTLNEATASWPAAILRQSSPSSARVAVIHSPTTKPGKGSLNRSERPIG